MSLTRPRLRHMAVLGCAALVLAVGCNRYRQTTNCPTPAASGVNVRDIHDPVAEAESIELSGLNSFNDRAKQIGGRIREEAQKEAPPGRPPRNVLCLSGGGSYGAYSAGVICGWTERGDRPNFDVVTGISTGSLVAPFAFLGTKYDETLKQFYTTVTNDNIFKKTVVRGVLGGEAFADTTPLRKLIGDIVTPEVVGELAAAHACGRRLIIGTTEEEASRFVWWNIGEIASRNGPGDRDLIIDVLVASAAIPGVFPPVKIDVTVDGKCMTERHVDGGVSAGVFFYPPYVPPEQRNPQTLNLSGTNVYIVLAGKLYADPEVVKASALNLAGRAVSSVLSAQARGDIQRMWTYSLLTGMHFHMTAIPVAYPDIGSGAEFDPKIMGGLFEAGRRMHCGEGWRTTPPLTDIAQGEFPQVRNGRCLTFIPKGPQLTIKGPGKMRVPPMYPDAAPQPPSGGQPAMALPR